MTRRGREAARARRTTAPHNRQWPIDRGCSPSRMGKRCWSGRVGVKVSSVPFGAAYPCIFQPTDRLMWMQEKKGEKGKLAQLPPSGAKRAVEPLLRRALQAGGGRAP